MVVKQRHHGQAVVPEGGIDLIGPVMNIRWANVDLGRGY
jgi:hypothetical protein